ncbi:dihydroxy-acid dehydratase domain-containing protein [Rhodopila globiformis]|uniref:Dihydroxy-acid dehydratase n=1 Tax=Rhodopila globiformis TaxID=1071 RepID=A0A2S6NIZ2_RHOGL|nr:dihydroxy-acid dehydratase [Rhodopila globiformis]PPQ34630.1 dihydroxy-acid dehydratase [Rhodopila globiformis]
MPNPRIVLIDRHPGRSAQTIGLAQVLGADPELIHEPSVGVVGTKGDSQCYLGVMAKVDAVHARLGSRIGKGEGQLRARLVQPEYTIGISDGIRNGTREMRYSLIGREVTHDALCEHLEASGLAGTIAVVACDKPPVGALAALLEHNQPAILMSDGPIHPGRDPDTGEALDVVSAFQVAGHPDAAYRDRIACHACPGIGSCGGMFTYNTMQTFIGAVGMQPLHMVAPASDDPRRVNEFPGELVDHLANLIKEDLKPRDIVVRDSLRNAMIVAMAIGGSTNVTLHAPEIARAAGYADFWRDIITPEEFNYLSQHVIPVLTDARPYGKYSMVDIDRVGGVQVIVRELLEAGLLNGDVMTCTGETLRAQVARLGTRAVDGTVIHPVAKPYKPTGGLRVLGGNLSPDFSAILKLAGVEGGLEGNIFRGRARVFEGEQSLIAALDRTPEIFQDHDMVVVRYEGPSGAPGMPEMLDPTSRITTLCRERGIVIALMTDARFSGGSVGLVIGHVGPEAALGGPIALIEEGDEIVADLNRNELTCPALDDPATLAQRKAAWQQAAANNGGVHPNCGIADTRLLHRARHTAVPATRGGGLHPNREIWVREPRAADRSGFVPMNKHRPEANKAF